VQVYVASPQTELIKPGRVLAGFDKTALLAPGETEELVIEIPAKDFAVYDDKLQAFVLEKGEYTVWVGDSLDKARTAAVFSVEKTAVVEKTVSVCAPVEGVKGESAITAAKDCIEKPYAPQYPEHTELHRRRGRIVKLRDVKRDESLLDAFANNMEFERKSAHSVIDERTVRELYLRVFDKAFSLHRPSCVMTSYNPVNGIYPSENPDLLEDLLRGCWGFEGFVMTDWGSYDTADSIKSIKAGTSLLTPGSKKYVRMVLRAVRSGAITKAALQYNVKQIIRVLVKCI
jgi:hypothetical protein